jgi:formamidopyrimidine-DNA glycosylase
MIIQAMPELPEVEVTRLSFADRIAGARIVSARVGKPLRWPLGCEPDQLAGRVVHGVRRRGKYLLLDLDDGRGVRCRRVGSGVCGLGTAPEDA